MKARHIWVEFPVFSDYIVHVEITSDLKKSLSKYPQTEVIPDEESDHCEGMVVHDTDGCLSFLFLKHNASVGTIAHESWHVIKRMLDVMGVEIDSETTAYHLGYLVNKVFQFMRGKK